ncbi:unnamed protein product [Cuscuta epithymum]|uniref:XS domain-containing protein n=1 Tax=Cuscuta epithymum TaxID=186058 RepID=A0AAV0FBL7_9ASTE|nr:unnamed protein product [Cuscuta epithymum]
MAGGGNTSKPPSSNSANPKPQTQSQQQPPQAANASNRTPRWESPGKQRPPKESKSSGSGLADNKPKPSPKTGKETASVAANANKSMHPMSRSNYRSPRPDLDATVSALPPFPFQDPPPPPTYGFHMLERRTIALADGSVRPYHALPSNYPDFPSFPSRDFRGPGLGLDRQFPMSPEFRPEFRNRENPLMWNRNPDHWNSLGLDGPGSGPGMGLSGFDNNPMKRKFGDEALEVHGGLERQRQQLLQQGNASNSPGTSGLYRRDVGDSRPAKFMRSIEANVGQLKHHSVDQNALKKAFLHHVKVIYENINQKNRYLADGKQGRLHCAVCGSASQDFPDMHSLIMHSYNSNNADSTIEHLGFHKALCFLMGWNYSVPPNHSKAYQLLSADEASANQNDLILWPPLVIIHNTMTGKRPDGRMEGLGNKVMDNYLRDVGFHGGKSKAIYSREGHLGISLVKFSSDQAGLKEAVRMAEYFLKDNRGRNGWARVQPFTTSGGADEDNNPDLVKVDQRTGEKKRVFYGYLATVSDMEKVDFETRKKVSIESRRELQSSS